ncbi:MAG: alpha/beta hydrolase [Shinella sp.]|jgi:acetyl esterase|nr:alpha/beta hydrolase [Shinella sp.]
MDSQWANIEFDKTAKRSMSVRVYEGARRSKTPPVILYLHGGAFLDLNQEPERPVARALAESGAIVVEADYSTPTQNAFPQVLEYAFGALRCLSGKRNQFGAARSLLLVAGEEAGGNVAAGVALKARDLMPDELDGQILLSPMIDPLMATASFRNAERIGMRERWSEGWSHYLGSGGISHPYAAPCQCSRLVGLAPALVVTAEDDPLRDEATGYACRLRLAGVHVRQQILPTGAGWTGIYRKDCSEGGKWLRPLRTQFEGFLQELSDRSH